MQTLAFYSIAEDYRRVSWIWFWVLLCFQQPHFPTSCASLPRSGGVCMVQYPALWASSCSAGESHTCSTFSVMHLSLLQHLGQWWAESSGSGLSRPFWASVSSSVKWGVYYQPQHVVGYMSPSDTHHCGGQQIAEYSLLFPRWGDRPLPWATVFSANSMFLMGDNLLILLEMADDNSYIV